jgi:hypothetical protein
MALLFPCLPHHLRQPRRPRLRVIQQRMFCTALLSVPAHEGILAANECPPAEYTEWSAQSQLARASPGAHSEIEQIRVDHKSRSAALHLLDGPDV